MTVEFSPDLILHNAKVVTVDPHFSIHEAVAVHGGKFVAVGSSADIRSLAGKRTELLDIKGRCVLPGQIDNHVHFLLAGLDALGSRAKLDIARLSSIEDMMKAIAERATV